MESFFKLFLLLVFSIDRLNFQQQNPTTFILPKYDNFPASTTSKFTANHNEETRDFGFRIRFKGSDSAVSSVVFYMSIRDSRQSLNPIVGFYHATTSRDERNSPIGNSLDLIVRINTNSEGWKFAECAHFKRVVVATTPKSHRFFDGTDAAESDASGNFDWSSASHQLIGVNKTHAICRFEIESRAQVFTVLQRADPGAFLANFSMFNGVAWTTPLCFIFAMFLSVLSLGGALLKHGIRTRFIRAVFICVFVGNTMAFFVLQNFSVDKVNMILLILEI